MYKLANAFALLGDEEDKEVSSIVAVKTTEAKKITQEHKKIVAERKKIDAEKKKAEAEKNKKKTCGNGNAVHQRYVNGTHQPLSNEEAHMLWLANRERWLAKREQWLAREAEKYERWLAREEEKNKDMALKTLKEYEAEQKALEKNNNKSTHVSVPEKTPLKEATLDNFTTKRKSNKNGPARGMGSQDSRINRSRAGDSKHNKDNALPDVKVKAEPAPAPAPDFSETNFPVLGRSLTKPTKSSVKHITKDNTH